MAIPLVSNVPVEVPALNHISRSLGSLESDFIECNNRLAAFLDRVAPEPANVAQGPIAKEAAGRPLVHELNDRADSLKAQLCEYSALLNRLDRLA